MPTAILVDGGFYLRRHHAIYGNQPPQRVAQALFGMCKRHLNQSKDQPARDLYRIFFYDCPPLTKKAHNPVTKRAIDFGRTDVARWRNAFHEELKKLRKVALRLGHLNEKQGRWGINADPMKRLLGGTITLNDLTETDVFYDVKQKGVDMRIGLDIASMCFKRQVDQIVLVAGDSDFVPAAKLARREGVDFILDPMWAPIRPDLHEHIDGLRSVIRRPGSQSDQNNEGESQRLNGGEPT